MSFGTVLVMHSSLVRQHSHLANVHEKCGLEPFNLMEQSLVEQHSLSNGYVKCLWDIWSDSPEIRWEHYLFAKCEVKGSLKLFAVKH